MIIIGGGIGLYYSWYIKPADFVDAAFFNLRSDYKTDYVLMVAEIYDQDHNNRLYAHTRLDYILDPRETKAELVEWAIKRAEENDYSLVDLEKMRHLNEMITGEKSTPTPQFDATEIYEMTATAEAPAQNPNNKNNKAAGPTATAALLDESGVPQAEQDPFGTGIQITTDPNAAPVLDLPEAPTITPNPDAFSAAPSENPRSGTQISPSVDGFSGVPDSFFEGR